MKRVLFKDLDLLEIGNSIHLEFSGWHDKRTGLVYLMPIDPDLDIEESKLVIIDTDDYGRLQFLRQADVVECRLYDGPQRNIVKAIIKKSQAQIEPRIVWEVFRRDNFTCVYCEKNTGPMTFDHWIPKALGGQTTVVNGRTSCKRCNRWKSDMSPEEWTESKEYKRIQNGRNSGSK